MHSLEVFTAKVYSKKTLKGNNLAELRRNIYLKHFKKRYMKNEKQKNRKQKKSVFEKMLPSYGAFQ